MVRTRQKWLSEQERFDTLERWRSKDFSDTELLDQLSRGRISLEEVIWLQARKLGKGFQELWSASNGTAMPLNWFLQFTRGEVKWGNWDDQVTPKRLAQILQLDEPEFCQAYWAGWKVRHPNSQCIIDLLAGKNPTKKSPSAVPEHRQYQASTASQDARYLGTYRPTAKSVKKEKVKVEISTSSPKNYAGSPQAQKDGAFLIQARESNQIKYVDLRGPSGLTYPTTVNVEKGQARFTSTDKYRQALQELLGSRIALPSEDGQGRIIPSWPKSPPGSPMKDKTAVTSPDHQPNLIPQDEILTEEVKDTPAQPLLQLGPEKLAITSEQMLKPYLWQEWLAQEYANLVGLSAEISITHQDVTLTVMVEPK